MVKPIVVRPKVAFAMIGVGKTLGFAMMNDGRLERVQLGPRAVGITLRSIEKLVQQGIKPPAAA
jgi:hypothetical protein